MSESDRAPRASSLISVALVVGRLSSNSLVDGCYGHHSFHPSPGRDGESQRKSAGYAIPATAGAIPRRNRFRDPRLGFANLRATCLGFPEGRCKQQSLGGATVLLSAQGREVVVIQRYSCHPESRSLLIGHSRGVSPEQVDHPGIVGSWGV